MNIGPNLGLIVNYELKSPTSRKEREKWGTQSLRHYFANGRCGPASPLFALSRGTDFRFELGATGLIFPRVRISVRS